MTIHEEHEGHEGDLVSGSIIGSGNKESRRFGRHSRGRL